MVRIFTVTKITSNIKFYITIKYVVIMLPQMVMRFLLSFILLYPILIAVYLKELQHLYLLKCLYHKIH